MADRPSTGLGRFQLPCISHLASPAREREREIYRPLRLFSGGDEHSNLCVLMHLFGRRVTRSDRTLRRYQIRTIDLLSVRHDEEVRAAVRAASLD